MLWPAKAMEGAVAVSYLIAATTAAADSFAAGGHFAREENMIRDALAHGIAVATHGVIRQRFALPWLHRVAARLRAETDSHDREHDYFLQEQVHDFIFLITIRSAAHIPCEFQPRENPCA